jgi:cytochrome d ubiquinol oxidase subunit I
MLSYLVYGDFKAEVKGLDCVPVSERPPQVATFFSFRGMVGLGTYMILLTLAGLVLKARGRLYDSRGFLTLAMYSVPVPIIANELGWVSAEVGRQPWIVYGLMKTERAFSPVVPAAHVMISIALITAVYLTLLGLWLFLLRREMERGPEAMSEPEEAGTEPVMLSGMARKEAV